VLFIKGAVTLHSTVYSSNAQKFSAWDLAYLGQQKKGQLNKNWLCLCVCRLPPTGDGTCILLRQLQV